MCRVCKAILIFGALMMFNVGVAFGAQWEFNLHRNAELCFQETVDAAKGADPSTLSTIYCTRALHDKPLGREDRSAMLFNRGIIHRAQGDLVAAQASFEKAVGLSRTVDKRNLALAEVARDLGDYTVALEQYDLLAKSTFSGYSEDVRATVVARRAAIEAGGIQVAGFDKAQACTGCHGADGISVSTESPSLAGQHADYIAHALRQYKNGQRQNAVMTAQAAQIADEDISVLARYFASFD